MGNIPKISNIIEPMGSNFDLINPTIGALITERGNRKEGLSFIGNKGHLSMREYKHTHNFSHAEETF